MYEVLGRYQVVRLNRLFDLVPMNSNSNAHKHVLWSFNYTATCLSDEIRTLQSLETKVVKIKISMVLERRVENGKVVVAGLIQSSRHERRALSVVRVDVIVQLVHHGREFAVRSMMEMRNSKASRQSGVVRV